MRCASLEMILHTPLQVRLRPQRVTQMTSSSSPITCWSIFTQFRTRLRSTGLARALPNYAFKRTAGREFGVF